MKSVNGKPIRILVLDDNRDYTESLKAALRGIFEVFTASSVSEANKFIAFPDNHRREIVDAVLLDIHLGYAPDGFEIARWYRKYFPAVAIILLTEKPLSFYTEENIVADERYDKMTDPSCLVPIVEKAVWEKQTSPELMQRRFSAMSMFMPFSDTLEYKQAKASKSGAQKVDVMTQDKYPIGYTVYSDPRIKDRNVISVASTVGCVGKCEFCESGKRPFVRALTVPEIMAQVYYGMQGYHARSLFEDPEKAGKLVLNFSCEGDVSSNMENACQAIELLMKMKGVEFHFIMTTIGLERGVELFLKKYKHLPVEFYWSVHTLIPEFREKTMPAAASQNPCRQRRLFEKCAEATKRPVTIAWAVAHGFNDLERDALIIRDFFGRNRRNTFRIKLMGMRKDSIARVYPGMRETTTEDLENFKTRLEREGFECRIRAMIGEEIKASCGQTVPFDPTDFEI